MRIGISALHLRLGRCGSHENYIVNLVRGLNCVQAPHEYLVFASEENARQLYSIAPRVRYVPIKLPSDARVLRIFYEQALLPLVFAKHRLDIVHFAGNFGPLWGPPARSIATVHFLPEPLLEAGGGRSQNSYYRFMFRACLPRVTRLIAPSEAFKQRMIAQLGVPAGNVSVVWHAVDPQFRPAEDRHQLGAFQTRYGIRPPYLLSVANCMPYKNLPRVVEAFAQLKAAGSFAGTLVIAGHCGEADQRLLRRSAPACANDIRMLGWVSGAEIPLLYAGASILVMPSLVESFGIPVIEAMACGVPVVISRIPELLEVSGGNAVVANPHDSHAIATGIERILGDRAFAGELRCAGLRRSREFTLEKSARRLIAAYADTAAAA